LIPEKELVLVKAGGSFITYKDKVFSVNYLALENLSKILLSTMNRYRIILGNGGGSFAHPVVKMFQKSDPKMLIVQCQKATRLLNKIIVDYLVDRGVPATSMQTSAFIYRKHNAVEAFIEPLITALSHGIIPVVYGECIFDEEKCYDILSTEKVFESIASKTTVTRIVLLTDVDGVYTCNPKECSNPELIPRITKRNIDEVLGILKAESGRDVTGSIYSKVKSMSIFSEKYGVRIYIVSGFNIADSIKAVRGEEKVYGTIIDMNS